MSTLNLIQMLGQLQNTPVEQGIIETIITVDEFASVLPWKQLMFDNYPYNREGALPASSFVARGASISDDSAMNIQRVIAYVRKAIVQVSADRLDARAAGNFLDVQTATVSKIAKALGRLIGNKLINGSSGFTATVNSNPTRLTGVTITPGPNHDLRRPVGIVRATAGGGNVSFQYQAPGDQAFGASSTPVPDNTASATLVLPSSNPDLFVTFAWTGVTTSALSGDVTFTLSGGTSEFDGLIQLTAQNTDISTATNGENLSFAILDNLALNNKGTGQKFYIMPARTITAFNALMRSAGGTRNIDLYGRQWPMYNNIPILRNDWLPTNQSKGSGNNTTSVFCVTMGEGEGVLGLWCDSATAGEPPPPNASVVAEAPLGISVWDMGIPSDLDARRFRGAAYVSLAQEKTPAVTVARGILN